MNGVETEPQRTLRPFWARIAILPSPVDEEQRDSGLIVPFPVEKGEPVQRGVVVAVDNADDDPSRAAHVATLTPGTVVWFIRGWKIRDLIVCDLPDILAYEAD